MATTEARAHEEIEKGRQTVHDTIDKAAEVAQKAADNIGEKSEQIKETQEQLMKECRAYVRQNPITALVGAIGIGFLLSKITS